MGNRVREEIRAVLPPTIFFFVALHFVAYVRVLMLKGTAIAGSTLGSATVAALILGKAVLVADHLPFINRFPHRPLACNVAWKTAIYVAVASLIHYLERLVEFTRQAGGLAAGQRKMLAEVVWPHFWAIQLVLAALILGYSTVRELVRAIGADRVRRMFFGPVEAGPVQRP